MSYIKPLCFADMQRLIIVMANSGGQPGSGQIFHRSVLLCRLIRFCYCLPVIKLHTIIMAKPKITKKVKKLSRTQVGVSLTKEDRDILKVEEEDLVEVSKQ